MKKLANFRAWLLGPKSDFILFIAVLILANLVASDLFFRLDLTQRKSYSLSEASKRTIMTIEEPLSIKVFFTKNLPAPYNSVERYLQDLLIEYGGVGNKRFSYEFFDMEQDANKEMAEAYGIKSVQIQELKNDEVGFKYAYMGLALVYSDTIEVLNELTESEGLEYKLTTTIGKTVGKANALAGLAGKVSVTLYASSSLKAFNIQGFDKLNDLVKTAYDSLEEKHRDKLEYTYLDVIDPAEVDSLASLYGIQKISWEAQGSMQAGSGLLGLVIEHGDKRRSVPISLVRGLFGGFGIAGLENLEPSMEENLLGLTANSLKVGYIIGHGERDLQDTNEGAAPLATITSDLYEFQELYLGDQDIPAELSTLIINGPRNAFSEAELYKLDQFLMRGGNLLAFIDPFEEFQNNDNAGMFGSMPSYLPIETGLERLFEKYGVRVEKNYVMDATCYMARQQGMEDMPLYFAPIIGKDGMNPSTSISRNLANVIFLNSAEVTLTSDTSSAIPLVSSSEESWALSENVTLVPYMLSKPENEEELARHNMAMLLEGRFDSAFEAAPESITANEESESKTSLPEGFASNTHLTQGIQDSKIILVGTSEITTPTLVDEQGKQPIAIFVRNTLDYLTGNDDLNDMRTKGLALDLLDTTTPAIRTTAKSFNQYGLPLLVAIAGLLAWRRRIRRKARIRSAYAKTATPRVEN